VRQARAAADDETAERNPPRCWCGDRLGSKDLSKIYRISAPLTTPTTPNQFGFCEEATDKQPRYSEDVADSVGLAGMAGAFGDSLPELGV
jgi:hypothetical protein